jgi:hypothetical protein
MKKTLSSSETSLLTRATLRNIPEDSSLYPDFVRCKYLYLRVNDYIAPGGQSTSFQGAPCRAGIRWDPVGPGGVAPLHDGSC